MLIYIKYMNDKENWYPENVALSGDNVGKSFLFEEMENEQPCADTFYICLLQFLVIVIR